MAADETPHPGTPAAQYVRITTEHQQYSTENQSVAILQYALAHGMTIVRTYADRWRTDPTYRPQNLVEWATRRKVDPATLKSPVLAKDATPIIPPPAQL